LAGVLLLTTWTGVPSITSLVVAADSGRPDGSPPTDADPSAEDQWKCSTRETTSTVRGEH
jgi:hypothetical protein